MTTWILLIKLAENSGLCDKKYLKKAHLSLKVLKFRHIFRQQSQDTREYPCIETMTHLIDLNILAKHESESVEWKKSGDDSHISQSIVKTITAFANDIANTGGGYVVCGAEESKDEYGFPKVLFTGLSSARFQEIENTVLTLCRDRVSPSIAPKPIPLENPENPATKILVFVVHATNEAHTFRDGLKNLYYVRSGRHTIEARNGILRELLAKKTRKTPFDQMVNQEATTEDIDLPYFRDQLSEMKLLFPNKSLEDYLSDKEQVAEFVLPLFGKLPLDEQIRPRNFTLLMFGKKKTISHLFTNSYTIFSVYPGKDRSEQHAERHELTGPIILQAIRAIDLLNFQFNTVYDKSSDKPNQRKYPERAVKEAVVNAIVHRDYEISEPNQITVFSDRIEIKSIGSLHWGVNKEKFLEGKSSAKWRNQTFAYLFSKLHLSQSEGQGIPTIFRLMKEEGCPPPRFEIEEDSVTCILPAHPRHALMRDIASIDENINLRRFDAAYEKIIVLLEQDPYNYRLVDLLCEVCHFLGTPERLVDFMRNFKISFHQLTPRTLINIADLLFATEQTHEMAELAKYISQNASIATLELRDIEKAVIALNRLRKKEEVIGYVDRVFREKPTHKSSHILLQNYARALIDRAKDSIETARDMYATAERKAKAWNYVRKTLDDADRHLDLALDHCPSESAKEYILNDREYIEKLRKMAEKPISKKHGNGRKPNRKRY